jgi:hypothetical protein
VKPVRCDYQFLKVDRERVEPEKVRRQKHRQPITLIAPEDRIVEEFLGGLEQLFCIRRAEASGDQTLFGVSQKVFESDRVLLCFRLSLVCWQID